MAYSAAINQMVGDKKLLDPLIADLITLSYECKRKYQPIKETAEACQLKVRGIGARSENVLAGLMAVSTEIIQPFVMGCDTKNPKVVQMSLTAIQRLISQKVVSEEAAQNVVNSLWFLMEARIEELKLLQTAILLITTNDVVKHEVLSKALALCFRMHFAKDSTTTNTAAATVRQLVGAVFDRVVVEDATPFHGKLDTLSMDDLKMGCKQAPKSLRPYAADAFLLFQDFCQLLNADQPFWLLGMTEMTRALCLELMEEVLANYKSVFVNHPEFTFLLSEKVCPHVIRLFSPSIKYRSSRSNSTGAGSGGSPTSGGGVGGPGEKPFFPIVIRLLRIVSVMILHYYSLLLTECEIFLSLLVKFLDPEKTPWQRTASLEVLGKLCLKPDIIRNFCESYDMKPHATKILRDIVNGVGVYIQSQFMNPSLALPLSSSSSAIGAKGSTAEPNSSQSVVISPSTGMLAPPSQVIFTYRNISIPLILNINAPQGSHKSIILEMLDKQDAPSTIDGYGLSLAFLCLLDTVKSVKSIIPPSTSSLSSSSAAVTAAVTAAKSIDPLKCSSSSSSTFISTTVTSTVITTVTNTKIVNDVSNNSNNSGGSNSSGMEASSSDGGGGGGGSGGGSGGTGSGGADNNDDGGGGSGGGGGAVVNNNDGETGTTAAGDGGDNTKHLHEELINSTWCGVLSALLLLLEASTEDHITETILKSLQTYATLCGSVGVMTPRDAFITALCKASLPPHYTLQVLGTPVGGGGGGGVAGGVAAVGGGGLLSSSSSLMSVVGGGHPTHTESIPSSQVVVVGTALYTSSTNQSAYQGPVVLTAKNIQSMKTLLDLAQHHGTLLGTSWHQVLNTLQHLVWILGLKPMSGGSMKPSQQASDNVNSVITTSIMSDLPSLSNQLTKLFESSQDLDDVSLHHLVNALCKLSSESLDIGYTNREPSLFAVAKLLETGLVNLARVGVVWNPITGHLLEACQHPHPTMRAWSAESITTLVKSAFSYKHQPPIQQQHKLQVKLLTPLSELSATLHPDIRHRQMDCVLQVVQSNGEHLCDDAWGVILKVIGQATSSGQSESLIRLAFQSLQLIVTDFLLTLPSRHLETVVDVVAMFGTQQLELNISLTAVGLLWNIADHFSQSRDKIMADMGSRLPERSHDFPQQQHQHQQQHQQQQHQQQQRQQQNLKTPETSAATTTTTAVPRTATSTTTATTTTSSMTSSKQQQQQRQQFDNLWMNLYCRLGQLCVDQRPAVRKSSGQTLFSMISAHGGLLQFQSWHDMLWKVLFPLLENVKKQCTYAAEAKTEAGGSKPASQAAPNILMHHSRDTAEKQWAETRFLTLAGVVRVASLKRPVLLKLGDFMRAWLMMLEHIEDAALSRNAEVSLAALKSFQELLNISAEDGDNHNHHNQHQQYLQQRQQPQTSGNAAAATTPTASVFSSSTTTMSNGNVQSTQPTSTKIQTPKSNSTTTTTTTTNVNVSPPITTAIDENGVSDDNGGGGGGDDQLALWLSAWKVWRNIGVACTSPMTSSGGKSDGRSDGYYIPSQAFLTALIQTFPGLYQHIREQFVTPELERLFRVLQRSLCVPVQSSSSSFFIMAVDQSLTPLQEAILEAVKLLGKDGSKNDVIMTNTYPELFEKILQFVEYSVHIPRPLKSDEWPAAAATTSATSAANYKATSGGAGGGSVGGGGGGSGRMGGDWIATNYVPFSEAIIQLTVDMYKMSAYNMAVIKAGTCQKIIKALSLPLLKKYTCPSKTTWVLSITSLLSILKITLPIARKHEKEFVGMWNELGQAFENFLFSAHPSPSSLTLEEFQKDEQLDCHVVETIRDEILPHSLKLPTTFISKVMTILNRGSIHTATTESFLEIDSTNRLREEFAKICFETLLQFSFIHYNNGSLQKSANQSQQTSKNSNQSQSSKPCQEENGVITSLAIEALLNRCKNVLEKYNDDAKHSGNFPLPRPQMTEVSFVLQAIATLLVTLKKNPSIVSDKLWMETIELYPYLVDSASSSSSSSSSSSCNINKSLHYALMQYMDLLRPPVIPLPSSTSS